jgi:hypothetical protein
MSRRFDVPQGPGTGIGAPAPPVVDCRSKAAAPQLPKTRLSKGHQVDLAVVWIFAELMIGGLALGALLILVRPRDDEAAALYRHERRRARSWLQDRLVSLRMPSRPNTGSRQ